MRFGAAVAGGVSRSALRQLAWERLSYGLYAPRRDDRPLAEVLRATAQLLPAGGGFGHLTSAELRDWWLPNRLPHWSSRVLFASTDRDIHRQRHGMYVRRSAHTAVEAVDGIPVMTAAETLVDLARDLSLVDLVPMVDRALALGASADAIRAAAAPRRPGSRNLTRALALSDPRSESWWESVLRLLHVLTGLGPVESQVEIHDAAGLFVARADLHLVGTRRYPECDGGEHRTRERHGTDLRRDKAITRLGLERYGYTTGEIAHQPELVIRDAEDARSLPYRPSRAEQWHRFATQSSLTARGRARLLTRLARYRRAADR